MVQTSHDDLPLALELDFDASTNRIDLRLYEHTETAGQAAIPLELAFTYNPETPFAPSPSPSRPLARSLCSLSAVREITDDRNKRIKQLYWKLWEFDSNGKSFESLKAEDDFAGEEVEIKQEEIERFCKGAYSRSRPVQNALSSRQSSATSRPPTRAQNPRSRWTLPLSWDGSRS
jgi:hypothetical protein